MIPAPGSSRRFHALDLWRGLVCLYVVVEHAGVALWTESIGEGPDRWLAQGLLRVLKLNVGTALFFAMSGFCMAASIDSSRRRGERPTAFLARRIWRIFPPYWAALLGFVAIVATLDATGLGWYHRSGVALELPSPGELDAWQWLGNLTLTETWRPLVAGTHAEIFTRIAWSLCYQEQFYFVCFLALAVAPRRFHRALFALTAAILLVRVAFWDSGRIHQLSGSFPIFWQEFAVGLAVYARLVLPTTPGARRAIELGLAGLLAIGLGTGFDSTAAASAFGLMLIAIYRWDGRIADCRWFAPLRSCGKVSYSLYLVHLPVVMLVNAWACQRGLGGFWPRALLLVPAATLTSIGVAWAFHRSVERHFLRLPSLGGRAAGEAVASGAGRGDGIEVAAPPRAEPAPAPATGRRIAALFSPMSRRAAAGAGVVLLTIGLAASATIATVAPRAAADRPATRPGSEAEGPDGWVLRHREQVSRAAAEAPRVVLLGDSIFDYWKVDHPGWAEAIAPLGAANLSIGGDHTQHLLWRVENGAVAAAPEAAVVLIGTNNLTAGMGPEETARGISAVVASIRSQSPRTRILLLGLLPRHLTPIDPMRERVREVNDRIARLDDGQMVRFVDPGAGFLDERGLLASALAPDSLHPSEPGYLVLADALAGPLRDLLDGPPNRPAEAGGGGRRRP